MSNKPAAVLVLLSLLIGGCVSAKNTVKIELFDYGFKSSQTAFERGVSYTFVLKNTGSDYHEIRIMRRGNKGHTNALFVVGPDKLPPGSSFTKEFTFNEPGEYEFACFLMTEGSADHYADGMFMYIVAK